MPKAMKMVTFSYDDGVTQDQRLIELLNKYGMKGTFNINSAKCGAATMLRHGEYSVSHARPMIWELPKIYEGHEAAAHGLMHLDPTKLSEEEFVREIEQDRLNLCDTMGYDVVGLAYSYGLYDDRVVKLLQEKTGIKYARTVKSTHSVEPQSDLLRFNPTAHHGEMKELYEITEKFIEMKTDTPKLLYIWGHAYEFDLHNTWAEFENYLKMLSGHDDIRYCTNREALLGE